MRIVVSSKITDKKAIFIHPAVCRVIIIVIVIVIVMLSLKLF